ncbi:MAG: hypothetical protein QHH10_04745 [Peptococcaceae bacterium]|jgi:hypothetical protein|nr:hypothetical protein [Peptococcaceae bacterium]MDH7524606.1 hypothetical protein [Peptococcaceae bacterium]
MKIEGFQISMAASHQLLAKEEEKESLAFWTGDQIREASDILDLSPEGKKSLLVVDKTNKPSPVCSEDEYEEISISDEDKLKIRLIEIFIETLTGKKVKIKVPAIKLKKPPEAEASPAAQPGNARQGWGLAYDYSRQVYEKETTTFSAEGVIRTSDGREIKIGLELNMSREFIERNEIRIRAGDAARIDPLAVNFGGGLAGLTEAKFSFDLDADGREEQVSFLQKGSGFLALDLNGDGIINNGRELFGPRSGDGFRELAAYDYDKNNWIDESDPVFRCLRIWTKDSEGRDYLLALGEVGIGAVYLGSTATPFALRDLGNQPLGEIQKTGLFLKEDGTAGTVQHVDLTV